jgi:hypothetical protein
VSDAAKNSKMRYARIICEIGGNLTIYLNSLMLFLWTGSFLGCENLKA